MLLNAIAIDLESSLLERGYISRIYRSW